MTFRLIGFTAITITKAQYRFPRLLMPIRHSIEPCIQHALSTNELKTLSLFFYEHNYWNKSHRKGLFSWEKAWLTTLPEKSKVLVTGAGDGREVEALETLGYDVWALEPTDKGVNNCRERMRAPSQAYQLSHEELIRLWQQKRAHPLKEVKFDAIMVGWGSLTHCYGEQTRNQLFSTFSALCPKGSILSSFWGGGDRGVQNRINHWQRKLSTSVGQVLGSMRKSEICENLPIMMAPNVGPGICFHPQEIERLAKQMNADVSTFFENDQPYAIFKPSASI